jgi:type IV secretory pathway ATPase VirB11/archaellum biosynthesis ATPase
MIITRTSMFSGKEHSIEIPVTEAQIEAWQNGVLIQKAMPNLTADQREFLMTGVTPEEWEAEFGSE